MAENKDIIWLSFETRLVISHKNVIETNELQYVLFIYKQIKHYYIEMFNYYCTCFIPVKC